MKVLLLVSLIFTTLANASIDFGDDFICTKNLSESSGIISILEIKVKAPTHHQRTDNIVEFEVRSWGYSRNQYSAVYLASMIADYDSFNFKYYLDKHIDNSTWSDMPEKLVFSSTVNGTYNFKGVVPSLGYYEVDFNHNECKKTAI